MGLRDIWMAAFLCLVVFAAFYALHITKAERTVEFFSQALQGADIRDRVVIEGVQYEIKSGSVHKDGIEISGARAARPLALAYQKTLARRSPLMAIPNIEPGAFLDAVALLEKSRDALAAAQKEPRDAALVKEGLYPISFLNELGALEVARDAFIRSGSDVAYERYEDALYETLREYETSLAKFRDEFVKAVPDTVGRYAVETRIMGRSDILNAIDALRTAVEGTRDRYLKRVSCMRNALRACDVRDLFLPSLPHELTPDPTTRQLSLEKEITRVLGTIPYSFTLTFGTRKILLSDSACLERDPEGAPLFTFRSLRPIQTSHYTIPVYVGNVHFLHLQPGGSYEQLPFVGYFAQNDLSYVPFNPLTYYECPEADEDLGRLFALYSILRFAGETRLNRYVLHEELRDSFSELEREIETADIVKESDLISYLRLGTTLLAQDDLHDAIRDRLEALVLQYAYRSSGTLQTILDLEAIEGVNKRINDRGIPIDLSARNLFFVRNALPALFLASNPSATGDLEPLYPENRLPREQQPYEFFSSLVHMSGGTELLRSSLKFYHDMHVQ